MSEAWLSLARKEFHATILAALLTKSSKGVPSNADKGSGPSVAIATAILDQIGVAKTAKKLPGQTAGASFEEICATFIELCFGHLSHLRPGKFFVTKGGGIAQFDQYSHLDDLEVIAKANREIATAIGSDYLIKPDIVVGREPETEEALNSQESFVDRKHALLSRLRASNQDQPILHASLSCKWTLRSDRAQNARSEGLNLVRNRKGRLPHVWSS